MANYLVLIIFLSIPHIRGEDKQGRLNYTTAQSSHNVDDPNRIWHWNAEVKHDPAGGVFRISGDGPKPTIADPVLDIGSGGGKDLLLTEEQVQSHPNYKYLSPLSECGRIGRSKTSKKNGPLVDLEDYYNEDLVGEKDDRGMDSESDEEPRIKRIVGGRSTRMRKHPWVVQLYSIHTSTGKHLFHCAGTIINNLTIQTAAHCITRTPSGSSLQVVVVGMEDRKKVKFCKTPNPAENCSRDAIKAIGGVEVHWNYSEGNLNNDIGLIYLKTPLQFSEHVRPICLPQSKKLLESWPSLKLTVVGWGAVNKFMEGTNSALLKEVEQDLQSRSLCDRFHIRIYGRTLDHRICIGGHSEKASCNGDSGGGLEKSLKIPDPTPKNTTGNVPVMQVERVFQFGIVSAGGHVIETCGHQGRPTIYTNVIFYMDWILNHIVQGSHSYHLKSGGSPVNSSVWQKETSRTANESEYKYKNEFSTGKNVDVSKHPNIHLLPSFNVCGSMIMTPHFTAGKSNQGPLDLLPLILGAEASNALEEEETKRKRRIVGGIPTKLQNYFPWMAQVYVRNAENDQLALRCSGTIITARAILLAAHCVTEISAPYVFDKIIVGQYNRNASQECVDGVCYRPQEVKIADTVIHPEYEKYTQRNSLALVRLSEDLQFTRMIQPICLPRRETLLEGIRVHKYFTAGWGIVTRDAIRNVSNHSDMFSELLLRINVNLRPRRDCDYVYSRAIDLLGRSRLCGGGKAARGECGDGGSPLMKKLETKNDHPLHNKILQLGIVTLTDCGMEGMPTIYMNVMFYMEWILNNLISDNS